MTKSRVAMVGALILAFAAGIPVGWIFNPVGRPVDAESYDPSWLDTEIELSETQKAEMREIWSRAAEDLERFRRSTFLRDKDDVVREILSDEQKAQYDEIESDFRQRRERLDSDRRARHAAAIEETLSILTPEQRSKFEELLEAQRNLGKLPMFGGQRGNRNGKRDRDDSR